jgi:3-isopropylmalate/(R)-2-methylmalate dehydratase large subunit
MGFAWCVKLNGPDVFLLIAISFMKLPVLLLGLKERGISVLYERTATADHNTNYKPTFTVEDPLSANQLRALEENSKEYGISHWD